MSLADGLDAILKRERGNQLERIRQMIGRHIAQTAARGLAFSGSPVDVMNDDVQREAKVAIDALFETFLTFCGGTKVAPEKLVGSVERASEAFIRSLAKGLRRDREELHGIASSIESVLPGYVNETKIMALKGFVGSKEIYCHQSTWTSYRSWFVGQLPKELVKYSLTTALGLLLGWLLWGLRLQ